MDVFFGFKNSFPKTPCSQNAKRSAMISRALALATNIPSVPPTAR